jgi:rubrerythrin
MVFLNEVEYEYMKETKVRKGWQCPICDSIVSPDNETCPRCEPKSHIDENATVKKHILNG